MFTNKEVKESLVEETKGTSEDQPLKFLVAPKDGHYKAEMHAPKGSNALRIGDMFPVDGEV